jgi:menaquinone-dependent protoporphyrinogen oxidase
MSGPKASGWVLVAYATKHGSTCEVAEVVAAVLREHELDCVVMAAKEVRDLDGYAGVVVGGSLYFGRWHEQAQRLLRRERASLGSVPVAVFAIGPRSLEPGEVAESRGQLDRALAKVAGLAPVSVAVFGGVVEPARLRFPYNRLGRSSPW